MRKGCELKIKSVTCNQEYNLSLKQTSTSWTFEAKVLLSQQVIGVPARKLKHTTKKDLILGKILHITLAK